MYASRAVAEFLCLSDTDPVCRVCARTATEHRNDDGCPWNACRPKPFADLDSVLTPWTDSLALTPAWRVQVTCTWVL